MPDDANGQYSLPGGYLAITGTTIQPSQHNPPLEDVATALSARLSRNGSAPMTGPLKAADGTVGAPSYTFNTAQTTGWYKTAGGNIGVAIAGAEVAEFSAGGMVKGGKFIGEIFDYSGVVAPPLCVLLQGQTLSRTTYAALWAFAQTQIAAGTVFYNNGDGSTTFGIADLRGRVLAMFDGVTGRLTTATIGAPGTIGATGGIETLALSLSQLPTGITSSGSNSITVTSTVSGIASGANLNTILVNSSGTLWMAGNSVSSMPLGAITSTGANNINVTSNNTGGGAHGNVQPTMICSRALFAGA